jgi:predicted dehydrogenase
MPKQRLFAVFLEEGVLVYDDLAASKLVFVARAGDRDDIPRGGGQPLPVGDEPPLTCAVKEFARAAKERCDDLSGLDLAVDVVRVLSKAQDSCSRAANAR